MAEKKGFELGEGSGLDIGAPLGIGTMQWGDAWLDKAFVNKGGGALTTAEIDEIFEICAEKGVRFFDTAEGYGGGSGERRLGGALSRAQSGSTAVAASKFLPLLWRWSQWSLIQAVRGTLRRMQLHTCPLYFIHTPVHPLPLEWWVHAACKAKELGLIKAIGLSNCNADQVRRGAAAAAEHGCKIAANQILFSLLDFSSEPLQDTLQACVSLGITVVGYGPVGQGLLADNLDEAKFSGIRMTKMTGLVWGDADLASLRDTLSSLALKYQQSMATVAINWVICKGAVPLVGARTPKQAREAVKALEFRLSSSEVAQLDARALSRSTFEKPRWRRAVFLCVLSTLMVAYTVTDLLFGLPVPKEKTTPDTDTEREREREREREESKTK